MLDSLPPLHWVSPKNPAGLRPVYPRLKKIRKEIVEDQYLDPSLNWIQGILGPRDSWIVLVEAYQLLQRTCMLRMEQDAGNIYTESLESSHGFPGPLGLRPSEMAVFLPPLKWPSLDGFKSGAGGFQPELSLTVAPIEASGIAWHLWCQEWQSCAKLHSPHFQDSLTDPHWLIHASYLWLCGILEAGGENSKEFSAALTAFGLGALGAFPRVECDLCFRLAISQRLRCKHHSVSTLVGGDDTKRIQNSSEARRACKQLNWPDEKANFRLPINPMDEETVLSGLLWPLYGKALEEKTSLLVGWLQHSPSVLKRLPADILELNANQILSNLRRHLDDSEWNIEAWGGKLYLAEQWFSALERVAPGPRPPVTAKNLQRQQHAEGMLAKGMKKSEIADVLGVSRSNLSNILRAGKTEHR